MATSKTIILVSGVFLILCSCLAHADEIDTTKSNTGIVASRFLSNKQLQFQSGDGVRIVAFPDSGKVLCGDYFVDKEGYADLPLIGMTKVVHRTPEELEKYLTMQYLAFLPRQNIIVRLMYRAALLGGFQKPGIYWIDPRGSLWDAIGQGGGTVREDGIGLIDWVHNDSGKVVTRNIYKYFQSEQSLISIGFNSGDLLTVTVLPKAYAWDYLKNYVFPFITVVGSIFVSYEIYHTYGAH